MTAVGRAARTVPHAPPQTPFFHSKLRAPLTPAHFVRRERLVQLLDDLTTLPVTLVVAPAGAGKTTLVADWAARSVHATSWLSLDDADRDAGRLWTGVIAALEAHVPDCGADATAELRSHRDTAAAVHALLESLETQEHAPLVLVLDGLEHVDGVAGFDDVLEAFVEHVPPWLHLVLVSRRTPRLPVERLQASGRLAEARFPQLRCSTEESVQVLTSLAPGISRSAARSAAAHSGGWAAALQLAGLAARVTGGQPGVPALADEQDRLVDEYLWREAFRGERPELVEMLLAICVVERVNPHLLEALTERGDAFPLLEEAEHRGLFLHRLDAVGWFQLHDLVREALVREAARRAPARLLEQHARAARWFEEAGEDTAALDHWLAAGRPREALALLARTALALYDEGHEATLRRVLEQLPPGVAEGELAALLDLAWCQLFVSRDEFLQTVDEARVVGAANGIARALRARAAVLDSLSSLTVGDWDTCRAQLAAALGAPGLEAWCDPVARFGWNVLMHATALAEEWDDDRVAVRDARASVGRDVDRLLRFEGTRALGLALAGRPVDALRVAAGVSRTAAARMTVLRDELALAEALARRELGDGPAAEELLQQVAAAPAGPAPWTHAVAALEVVEARLAVGEVAAADAAFGRAGAYVAAAQPGPGGRSWVARVGTRLALAKGDRDAAEGWAAQVADAFWGPVSRARVALAGGDLSAADALLEGARARCVRHGVVRGLLRARATGSAETAVKLTCDAVEQAAEAGMLQTVVAEGEHVAELVERAAWAVPPDWLDRWRRASVRTQPSHPDPALPERLTDREREVLRLLSSRLTLREIADELYVSINTLKFHLRVIYRKLDVSSRAEAVEVAQARRAPSAVTRG